MFIFSKSIQTLTIIYTAGILTAGGHQPEAQQPFELLHAHDVVEFHAHLGWESRYFSEGRDSLDGDSLIVGSFEMGWEHLAGGIWYAYSPDQDYDELQLTLALTQSIGDFEFYGGYTHLRFPFEDAYDNEIGAGMTWTGFPWDLDFSVDCYYSFDADGLFADVSIGREFSINDRLNLNLSIPFGINQGYVADGHDGANYFALRLEIDYVITDSFSLIAHASQSWGIDRDTTLPGDDQLTDFFHGGVGVQWKF